MSEILDQNHRPAAPKFVSNIQTNVSQNEHSKSHKMKTNKQNFMQFPPFVYALKLSFRQGTQITNVPFNSITQLTFISKV